MVRAWEGFRFKPQWQELQKRGMQMDFSWDTSAKEYVKLYNSMYGITEEPSGPQKQPELVNT
jgi:starch synthase